MNVTVKVVGMLAHSAGFSERRIDVAADTTTAEVLRAVSIDLTLPMVIARNGVSVRPDEVVHEGDRIVVAPMFSGG